MDSRYEDPAHIAAKVAAGDHRSVIGGRWDEIGRLQFDALVARGLKPQHRLLDVGCGSLRGGVHFIPYLDAGNYYGLNINRSLIEAGLARELDAEARARVSDANFHVSTDFEIGLGDTRFDMALAVSLFTHMSQNRIELCLARLRPRMVAGGSFYATVFEAPEDADPAAPLPQGDGIHTHAWRDPFHYAPSQLRSMAARTGWALDWIGDFGHPRAQKLVRFIAPGGAPAENTRALPPEEAATLKAGAHHYRAYVGPAHQFDFMGATQFRLLTTLGLREHHDLLDFGCGSLRAGRLLMAYLQPGRYHGIEPNTWLLDDAIARDLGAGFVARRQPQFDANDRFDMTVFGKRFDFIVAQSIFSHAGPDLVGPALASARAALADDGLMLATFIHRANIPGAPLEQTGWRYPGNIAYRAATVRALIAQAGLVGRALPWFHPRQTWYALARDAARLPAPAMNRFLRGAVLGDAGLAASLDFGKPSRDTERDTS